MHFTVGYTSGGYHIGDSMLAVTRHHSQIRRPLSGEVLGGLRRRCAVLVCWDDIVNVNEYARCQVYRVGTVWTQRRCQCSGLGCSRDDEAVGRSRDGATH